MPSFDARCCGERPSGRRLGRGSVSICPIWGIVGENATSAKAAGKRFNSWKEIAAHLQRDVRTVQRWEKNEGLRFIASFTRLRR